MAADAASSESAAHQNNVRSSVLSFAYVLPSFELEAGTHYRTRTSDAAEELFKNTDAALLVPGRPDCDYANIERVGRAVISDLGHDDVLPDRSESATN